MRRHLASVPACRSGGLCLRQCLLEECPAQSQRYALPHAILLKAQVMEEGQRLFSQRFLEEDNNSDFEGRPPELAQVEFIWSGSWHVFHLPLVLDHLARYFEQMRRREGRMDVELHVINHWSERLMTALRSDEHGPVVLVLFAIFLSRIPPGYLLIVVANFDVHHDLIGLQGARHDPLLDLAIELFWISVFY